MLEGNNDISLVVDDALRYLAGPMHKKYYILGSPVLVLTFFVCHSFAILFYLKNSEIYDLP